MDIRCERCLTEYELEDESVSESGTSVQCTGCNYTFVVTRPPRPAPAAVATPVPVTPPPIPEWLLETDKGQAQRFRDLSALHHFIVERKVTRADRISRTGQGWKRLEEIVELKPFFDVVDEADRAKAAVALVESAAPDPRGGAREHPGGGQEQAPRGSVQDQGRSGAQEQAPRGGPQPSAPRGGSKGAPRGGGQEPVPRAGASDQAARGGLQEQARSARASGPQRSATRGVAVVSGRSARRAPEVDTSVVQRRGLSKLLVTVGVAGAVAYFGITHLPPVEGQSVPKLSFPGALKWASLGSNDAPVVSAGSPAAAAVDSPTTAVVAKAAAMRAAAGKASVTEVAAKERPPAPEAAPPKAAPADGAGGRPARAEAAAGDDRPYAELVKEARRLQENGAITRARKMYETALQMHPDGVEALAGMGYVQLDRNKFGTAISYFRRALAIGSHPPALFGMAEAYRYAGDPARAVEAYRRFLSVAPDDRDAPIARRQIRTLGSQPRSSPSRDVGSASSILQEGAR